MSQKFSEWNLWLIRKIYWHTGVLRISFGLSKYRFMRSISNHLGKEKKLSFLILLDTQYNRNIIHFKTQFSHQMINCVTKPTLLAFPILNTQYQFWHASSLIFLQCPHEESYMYSPQHTIKGKAKNDKTRQMPPSASQFLMGAKPKSFALLGSC